MGGRFDGVPDDFDAVDDFSYGDAPLDRGPTPALLAARAEPLESAGDPTRRQPRRPGGPPRSSRPPGARKAAARQQSARARARRKPAEPNRLWLALGAVAVVLAGAAAAYLLFFSGDDGSTVTGDEVAGTTVVDESATTVVDDTATTVAEAADPASPSTGEPPVVVFDEAAVGPIRAATPYTIGVTEPVDGATYQLLVDDVPQAEPAAELPPTQFEPGRHLLVIEMVTPTETVRTVPVVVYAIGEEPTGVVHRSNLSSVSIADQGWGEAVRQFDEYVAAGHTDLQLMPSDLFAELTPGYWNLFVPQPDSASALAYCEQFGLVVPDECFPRSFDASATGG